MKNIEFVLFYEEKKPQESLKTVGKLDFPHVFKWGSREPAIKYLLFLPVYSVSNQVKYFVALDLLHEGDPETWLPDRRKIISVQFKITLQFSDIYIWS